MGLGPVGIGGIGRRRPPNRPARPSPQEGEAAPGRAAAIPAVAEAALSGVPEGAAFPAAPAAVLLEAVAEADFPEGEAPSVAHGAAAFPAAPEGAALVGDAERERSDQSCLIG